jgi:5,5'-dehydrodivanillate O-demethylase
MLDCNWFQAMENSVDPAHLQILHQEFIGRGRQPVNTTRGFIDDVGDTDFYVTDYGIMKKRTYVDGRVDEHPLVFPNILRQGYSTQIRVPVDDTHTWHVWYQTYRFDVPAPAQASVPVYRVPLFDAAGDWLRDYVDGQDICAWVTQGPVADRSREHLGRSDLGVIMLRKLYFEQMERVEAGQDPICVFRGPPGNECIELPMEREKFGGAQAFRRMWLRESSIRYSPIRDEVLSLFGDAA